MQKPRVKQLGVAKTGAARPQWQEGVRFEIFDAVAPRGHRKATEEGR